MPKVFAAVLTRSAVANNNRGETEGNVTTLHKCVLNGRTHTTVSAEAIRAGIRYRAQKSGESVFRHFDEATGVIDCNKKDHDVDAYYDDDVMGFMLPKEGEEGKKKGSCDKRTSPLSVSSAISLTPWDGTVSYNCQNSTKTDGALSLYGAEIHGTQYRFVLGIDVDQVIHKERIPRFFDFLADLGKVGGNHSRYLYDFSPETVVYRVTEAHSPRLHDAYSLDGDQPSLANLIETIEAGDVPAEELIVGGKVARTSEGKKLAALGAEVFPGVNAATDALKAVLKSLCGGKTGTNGVAKSRKTAMAR